MNFLLFTLEYPPFHGGVANYYGNLIKYWPASPDNIFVLDNNDARLINKSLPFLKWLPAIFQLSRAVKKNKINYVIVGQILPLGLATLIFSWFYKIKYTVILHGMDFSFANRSGRKKIISKFVLNKAEKIICVNSYTGELVKKFLSVKVDNKIIIVNPGIENYATHNSQLITQLKKKYNLENKIILLSVGRLVKRKGFDMVIKAMPQILKKIPNLAYVIVGNGEEVNNLKLNNNIILIKNADDEEKNGWYNVCDIFIMPSREINGDFEGFGIVYLEANLAGKPVIAGKSGGVADAVVNGLNGLIVNPESLDEISQAVIRLAQNENLRHKLGEIGKQRALSQFNWQIQIEKLYKSII